jgi:hypothetical protein
MQAEGTGIKSWRSNPPQPAFILGINLASCVKRALALWLDEGTSTPNPTKAPSPCKPLRRAQAFQQARSNRRASLAFSVLQKFAKQKKISKLRMTAEIIIKRHELLLAKLDQLIQSSSPSSAPRNMEMLASLVGTKSTRVLPNLYPKSSLGYIIHMHKQSSSSNRLCSPKPTTRFRQPLTADRSPVPHKE